MTDFFNKVVILGKFYINYREDEELGEFIEFNDIGLPLAYLASENLCSIADDGKRYVAETFDLFLATLGLEDTGFETLEEVFEKAQNKNK